MARRPRTRPFARRYAPLLVALVAVLVVVGLRTDDTIGGDLPGPTADEASDDRPATSTSTTRDEEPSETVPSTTINPNLDDPEDAPESLREALLAPDDLPSGWREAALSTDSTEICPGHDPAGDVPPESALKASFARTDDGPYLTSLVAEFDGDEEADDYLDALAGTLEDCDGFESETGLVYQVDRTPGADLGDRSVNATLQITAGDRVIRGRVLSVRVGERVALIAFSASGDADAAIAVDALETVVARLDG